MVNSIEYRMQVYASIKEKIAEYLNPETSDKRRYEIIHGTSLKLDGLSMTKEYGLKEIFINDAFTSMIDQVKESESCIYGLVCFLPGRNKTMNDLEIQLVTDLLTAARPVLDTPEELKRINVHYRAYHKLLMEGLCIQVHKDIRQALNDKIEISKLVQYVSCSTQNLNCLKRLYDKYNDRLTPSEQNIIKFVINASQEKIAEDLKEASTVKNTNNTEVA